MRVFLGVVAAALWLPVAATTTDIYYHNDLAGTPLAATEANGNLLWRQGYKPYGERLDPKAPAEQQPWFTGKAHVEAAGLSYFGARWYDPQLGRFMGVDPRGFDEANVHSFNRYAYANNNPYRYVDPDGRAAQLLLRSAYVAGYRVGSALGLRAVGGSLGIAAYNALHQENADSTSGDRSGAKDAPTTTTGGTSQEWIYGPKDDPKVYPDGSTRPNTWTSPDSYPDRGTATDKLDPFKPVEGRRPVTIPEGTDVKRGKTPGGEGPYRGRGGASETLVPGGLPPGSVGPWEPLP